MPQVSIHSSDAQIDNHEINAKSLATN